MLSSRNLDNVTEIVYFSRWSVHFIHGERYKSIPSISVMTDRRINLSSSDQKGHAYGIFMSFINYGVSDYFYTKWPAWSLMLFCLMTSSRRKDVVWLVWQWLVYVVIDLMWIISLTVMFRTVSHIYICPGDSLHIFQINWMQFPLTLTYFRLNLCSATSK